MTKMGIWDAVRETDMAFTKPRPGGGNLLTIDAYYQFERATKMFGPVGDGWGWSSTMTPGTNLCIMEVRFWWKDLPDVNRNEFTVYGACPWMMGRKSGDVLDADAPKKALTEALSKALSMLGFSADIYQGKLDRGGYTPPSMKAPQTASQPPSAPAYDAPPGEDWLQEKVGFGKKHADDTWQHMANGEITSDRFSYCQWIVKKADKCDPTIKERAARVIKIIENATFPPDDKNPDDTPF